MVALLINRIMLTFLPMAHVKAVIGECQCYFNFDSVSDIIAKRTHNQL